MYTDPGPDGPVSEAEYHDWYDHEHGPARMTVPGFTGARRYQAIDGQQPPWLALYETASLEVLDGQEYKALVAGGSDREKFIMSHLATLDRRVYEQVSEDLPSGASGAAAGAAPAGAAPAILSVANTVPPETEDDMAAWYASSSPASFTSVIQAFLSCETFEGEISLRPVTRFPPYVFPGTIQSASSEPACSRAAESGPALALFPPPEHAAPIDRSATIAKPRNAVLMCVPLTALTLSEYAQDARSPVFSL